MTAPRSARTSTVLVTGATGTVGTALVQRLHATGVRPRALVRDPERARARLGADVELAVGDLADATSVRTALRGVDTVFLACGNVPDQVAHECTVIDAARDAGVRRLVKLSARGADPRATNAYWRDHAAVERHLAGSGIPSVVLRPSFLMSNLLAAAEQVRHLDALLAPAGSAQIAMVDPADVAEVAAVALTDPELAPGVVVLTGPDAVGYAQVAAALSTALDRPIAYRDVPPEAMVHGLVQAGVPAVAAAEVVRVFDALRAGDQRSTTDAVLRLTGRPAASVSAFVRRHAHAFGTPADEAVRELALEGGDRLA